jgi:hypothetical protein
MTYLSTRCAGSIAMTFSPTLALLPFATSRLAAQAPATDQNMQALREEVIEPKRRLAEVEAKLATLPPAVPAAADKLSATAPLKATRCRTAAGLPAPVGDNAALPAPANAQAASKPAPFAFGDFTWMNGQSRQKSQPLSNSFATVNLYLDTYYGYSFNHPKDDTIVGSGAVGRDTEFQINNATIGVDTNYKNVIGKVTLQVGNQLAVTQDLDGTVNRGPQPQRR